MNHNVTIYQGDEEIFSYVYDDTQFKPYVKKLVSPGGLNVLLDSPDDHKHHHGLMFAFNVDGTNFWEEVEKCGRQEPQNTSPAIVFSNDEKSEISFESTIQWVRPEKNEILLMEKRTIRLETAKNLHARIVTWTSQLNLPEKKPPLNFRAPTMMDWECGSSARWIRTANLLLRAAIRVRFFGAKKG